ncbi:DUF489 family protein, partial [Pseudomonas aeruginosa]|uniref:DUF489 family protein n=1 Tax=Pseudomonas aeruginosa TaxID=287 RepID=UPI0039687FF8
MLSLMVLHRNLAASKGAMDTLGNRIAGLHRQLEHFGLQSETLLSAMARVPSRGRCPRAGLPAT